jgi:hypothetical protein
VIAVNSYLCSNARPQIPTKEYNKEIQVFDGLLDDRGTANVREGEKFGLSRKRRHVSVLREDENDCSKFGRWKTWTSSTGYVKAANP